MPVRPFSAGSAGCPLPAVYVDCNVSLAGGSAAADAVDVGLLHFPALD